MKSKITLLLLISFFYSYSQTSTTFDEYTYLTKGYKITIDSGLDLKKGYEFKDLYLYKDSLYNFDYKLLIDTNTKLTKAILVIADSHLWGNKYYLCIPINNPELYYLYELNLKLWDKDILKAYSSSLSQILTGSMPK